MELRVSSIPQPILSPCIGICELGPDGLCVGCFRSGDEIAGWIGFSTEQRAYLMDHVLPERAEAADRV